MLLDHFILIHSTINMNTCLAIPAHKTIMDCMYAMVMFLVVIISTSAVSGFSYDNDYQEISMVVNNDHTSTVQTGMMVSEIFLCL